MMIRAMVEHAPLVHALVRAGYEAGARWVEVDYQDLEVLRSQIALAPDEAVGTAPRADQQAERLESTRMDSHCLRDTFLGRAGVRRARRGAPVAGTRARLPSR